MESKKINQLATNVAPQTSDLTIIGDPVTGVSKKITLLQIANLFATTGTVTSVAVTETGDALTITGSPITSAGTINIGFAGDATQYVRGDGALADFPTSTGGGSSVSYYLNSSVSQGTIGGVAYRELSKEPVSGAGTDITASTNGYIASYITDANDPALLEVPGGNFNCEFYFSVNSNNHDPYVYAELYKYDGSTFTLLGSSQSVPEYLTNGTTLSPYYFAIPVAASALTITDRLAIRIYVNVDGRVVTLHTENNHLCQVVTTFSKGLTSLNNLTRQVQFLATGTSGTDFNISSTTATHTFNIPDASATNRGLITTGSQTIAGDKSFTGINSFDYGINYKTGASLANVSGYISQAYATSGTGAGSTLSLKISDGNSVKAINLDFVGSPATYTYTYPALSGTMALLEGSQTFSGNKTFSALTAFTFLNGTRMDYGLYLSKGSVPSAFSGSTTNIYSDATTNNIVIRDNSSIAKLDFNNSTQTYTFPAASGTIALTSDLGAYVTLATTQTISGAKTFGSSVTINTAGQSILSIVSSAGNSSDITSSIAGVLKSTISTSATEFKLISAIDNILKFQSSTNFRASLIFSSTADYSYTYPNATGTLALTSNLSAYLPLAGGTLTGALSGTSATFSAGLVSQGAYTGFQYNSAGAYPAYNTYFGAIGTNFSNANSELDIWNTVGGGFVFRKQTAASTQTALLTIASSGAATFSSSVNAGGLLTINVPTDNTTVGIFHAGGGTANRGLKISTFAATNDNAGVTLDAQTSTGVLAFATAGAEKMRITSGGNVGIGTSNPTNTGGYATLTIGGNSTIKGQLTFNSTTTPIGYLYNDATNMNIGSENALIFATTSVAVERMRITSGGYLKQKANGGSYFGGSYSEISNFNNVSGDNNLVLGLGANASNTSSTFLICANSVGDKLYIYGNGNVVNTNNSYGTLSDISLKENIIDATPKLADILNLKVRNFNLIGDDTKQIGFIAQELEEVFPSMIDIDGKSGKKAIKTSVLVPMLVKAIQEQQAQIEELKAKIK